jgi:hypothetical protein
LFELLKLNRYRYHYHSLVLLSFTLPPSVVG